MNHIEALEKWKAEHPSYNNLSQMEKTAFSFGFFDGFKMGQEDAQEKLEAYRAYVAGKINRAALEEALK